MLQLLTYDQIESIKKVRKEKQSPNYIFVYEKDEVKEQIVSNSERWGRIKRMIKWDVSEILIDIEILK